METKAAERLASKTPDVNKGPDIGIQRVFQVPVNKVWKALTEADEFKKWWGPKDYPCTYSQMEARVGGKYLSCMTGPDGKEYWSTGVVKEFEPDKKLVVTDHFADKNGNIKTAKEYNMAGNWPDELLITFELEEADGATKLKLTHEGIPAEMYEECKKGWEESFDKMEKNII